MLGKFVKLVLVGALLAIPIGCGAAGTRIQQERQAELMDEREDEMMNHPATEYRQEQVEDLYGE